MKLYSFVAEITRKGESDDGCGPTRNSDPVGHFTAVSSYDRIWCLTGRKYLLSVTYMVHVKDEVGLGLFFRNSQASERNISVKTEDSVVPKILKIILDNFRIRLLQNQAQGEAQDPQPVAANGYASLNRRFLPVKTEFLLPTIAKLII